MQCSACGTQLPVGTAYCPTCGNVTPYQVSSSGVSPTDTTMASSSAESSQYPYTPLILTPLLHQRHLHLHPTVEGSQRGALLSRSSSYCSSSEQVLFSTSERHLPLANHTLTLPRRHQHSGVPPPLPLRRRRTCLLRALQLSMIPYVQTTPTIGPRVPLQTGSLAVGSPGEPIMSANNRRICLCCALLKPRTLAIWPTKFK
jgi:hypothetical protein